MADALLTCDDRFRSVLSSLLGRTLVFDTIDHATAMAKALRYRVRVVTLDGQQINVGGSFTGGSTSQRGGALSRAAEVRALTEEQKRLDGQVSEAEQELDPPAGRCPGGGGATRCQAGQARSAPCRSRE